MRKSLDYRALFEDEGDSSSPLARELEAALAVHPAPEAYRESLRAQLLAAAQDESFYRQGITRRFVLSMAVVVVVALSVVGLIAWRSRVRASTSVGAQSAPVS